MKSDCDLKKLYVDEGMSITQIAKRLNIATGTVWNKLNEQGVPRRGKDYWKGKSHSKGTKQKMRDTHLKEKNPNWNGGIRKTNLHNRIRHQGLKEYFITLCVSDCCGEKAEFSNWGTSTNGKNIYYSGWICSKCHKPCKPRKEERNGN